MDLRRPWPFALLVLVAHALSRFLGVATHEALGHTAVAFALGGSAYGLFVSPGSGFTYVYLPNTLPAAGVVAMQAAGIAVESLVGLLIWWRTRRSPSFAWRAFGLVAASVFVVYSLVYMAAGAFDFFPGDTWAIVTVVGTPLLAAGFLVAGGVWTLLVGTLLSLDVARLFQDGGPDLRRDSLMLILFWIVPAPLAFLPGFSAEGLLSGSFLAYMAVFVVVLVVVALVLLYVDLQPKAPLPPAKGVSWRPVAAAALPFLLILPVWLGVFGVSADEAKGVLLETPPLQAEQAWLGALAVNLEVRVAPDFNVTLVWRFRGTFAPSSPLEAQVAASFEGRMDRTLYNGLAVTYVGYAMNESSWIIVETDIRPNETVWSAGQEYRAARIVELAPSPYNRRTFLTALANGTTLLTVQDPFKSRAAGPTGGWLDSLRIVWASPLVPFAYPTSGGTGATRVTSSNYVAWQSYNRFQAPDTYGVLFG